MNAHDCIHFMQSEGLDVDALFRGYLQFFGRILRFPCITVPLGHMQPSTHW